ncbi:hypothetical protein ECG_08858 [Echinococcus granulosus]|uniref:Expressed conserved protein n=1 Tax=Echinococcus granulosus TaxID=6210 RepID=A0A068WV75_ECHGR|nr:hypothetical protein ECG_08858 [Echinococcus granulosus]CDS23723.1 expressed conserved protein [Echinococcus granulosus]
MSESGYESSNESPKCKPKVVKRSRVEDTLPPCSPTSAKRCKSSKPKCGTVVNHRKQRGVSAMNRLFQRFKKRTRNYLFRYASRNCDQTKRIRRRPPLVSGKARVRRQRGCIKKLIPKNRASCTPRKQARRQLSPCQSSSRLRESSSSCYTKKSTTCESESPNCSSSSSTPPRRNASRRRLCSENNSGDWKSRLRPRPLKSNRYPNYRCLLQGRGCDRNCSNTSIRLRESLRSRFLNDTSNNEEVFNSMESSPTAEDLLVSQVVVEPTILVNSVSGDAPDIDSIEKRQ